MDTDILLSNIIKNQAITNIGTIGHVANGKSKNVYSKTRGIFLTTTLPVVSVLAYDVAINVVAIKNVISFFISVDFLNYN